jgi:gas vesicle protein
MINRARASMKFFVYGLLLGLAFAPSSGKETRSRVMGWFATSVRDVVKL